MAAGHTYVVVLSLLALLKVVLLRLQLDDLVPHVLSLLLQSLKAKTLQTGDVVHRIGNSTLALVCTRHFGNSFVAPGSGTL